MKILLHECHDHSHETHDHDGKDMKTLAALISHWISHGEDHVESYREWAEKAKENGRNDVYEAIHEAVKLLEEANEAFKRAAALMK